MERIRKWGKKKGMQPLMMSIFVRYINAWMRHKTLDIKGRLLPGNTMHQKLIQAISEQEKKKTVNLILSDEIESKFDGIATNTMPS